MTAAVLTALLAPPAGAAPAAAASAPATVLPAGFRETVALSGLDRPTNLEVSPDGRLFVAEKSGLIKVFDGPGDPTPDVFADLRTPVNSYGDRGLLGLGLPPGFPANPWVYVLYTYDAAIGGTSPRWRDDCPTPPGPTADGCVVSGRLVRIKAAGNKAASAEQVLINDWCQQFPSHSVGDIAFGPAGELFLSAGEGSDFTGADYGQKGAPRNPCGDPPGGVGAILQPPTAAGGALRSQDVRTLADPTGLDGTVLRVDASTGAALPANYLYGRTADRNARRIVGHGLRNPWRLAVRPGTREVWVADVGWYQSEEINRIADPSAAVPNFGWPCMEGTGRQPKYDAANLDLCESLYAAGGGARPYYSYNAGSHVIAGEACPAGAAAISGLAFGPASGSSYPPRYRGALFFSDYVRNCIWAMLPGAGGLPDRGKLTTFATGAAYPVDLEFDTNGDLLYVDVGGGTVRRIRYTSGNQAPVAAATATPAGGAPPLAVHFDGRASRDPEGGALRYSWDFTGNGTADAVGPTADHTYTAAGGYGAVLTVTDAGGAADTVRVTIDVGAGAPQAVIDTPTLTTTWRIGQVLAFSGHANDPQDGALPATRLRWQLLVHHCRGSGADCHVHYQQSWAGVRSGSFSAPEHEYPSYLELQLTATDSGGRTGTASVRLNPQAVQLRFQSEPPDASLIVDDVAGTAPFTRTVITGSAVTVSAPAFRYRLGVRYTFTSWSDGGARVHTITAGSAPATYMARYAVSTG